MNKEKKKEGKFWLKDLGNILQEENVCTQDEFKHRLDLYLQSSSKIIRWLQDLHGEKPYREVSIAGNVRVAFTGYYDGSGRDISVVSNMFLPEDLPMYKRFAERIASDNHIMFSGEGFYGPDKRTNNLETVRSYIRAISKSHKQIERLAENLFDGLYDKFKVP